MGDIWDFSGKTGIFVYLAYLAYMAYTGLYRVQANFSTIKIHISLKNINKSCKNRWKQTQGGSLGSFHRKLTRKHEDLVKIYIFSILSLFIGQKFFSTFIPDLPRGPQLCKSP